MRLIWLIVFLVAYVGIGALPSQAQLFIDGFESGAIGSSLGNPWDNGAAGLSTYVANPGGFTTGSVVAELDDPGSGSVQLATNDLSGSINGAIATISFEFLEPTDTGPTDSGTTIFGFSETPYNLNTAGRIFRGNLGGGGGGTLGGTPIDEGVAFNYALDQVHTVFMVANDSANPVVNYRDGQTLDADEADVWIQTNGSASPTFAFSIARSNVGKDMAYASFRTFSSNVGDILIDNYVVTSGIDFDRNFVFAPSPGDVNADGTVDITDYNTILGNLYQNLDARTAGDVVDDGVVNLLDFRAWKDDPANTVPLSALGVPVPEPSACCLLCMTAAAALTRRGIRAAGLATARES